MNDPLIHRKGGGLPRLLAIMRRLRDPQTGCPWDIAQDFASIAPYTIEEAYEVADAIARENWEDLEDELGDLLLQVVYHAQMASEAARFGFHDVADRIAQKMLDRHPHVFGQASRDKTPRQQSADWEALKARERGPARTLDGVALGLPALLRAVKLQNRAARVGFDWPETTQVLDKLREEMTELTQAETPAERHEEFGDLMFVMANLARHMGIDPEAALRDANAKFTRRFAFIEDALARDARRPSDSDLAEMDSLWNEAKAAEKKPRPDR